MKSRITAATASLLLLIFFLTACQGGRGERQTPIELIDPPHTQTGANPSLPVVSSGRRPGPAVLYQPAPTVPELALQPPFKAQPLMVSGVDALCGREYLYQDYLFDDHGANTQASLTSAGAFGDFPPTGDVQYPDDAARYANNAADIVEFRLYSGPDSVHFRITFNTLIDPAAPMIGIGISTDPTDNTDIDWPAGAGISSPGLTSFITAWHNGGEIRRRGLSEEQFSNTVALPPGAVSVDTLSNQMTIQLAKELLPAAGKWRLVAGAGLWDGDRGFLPVIASSGTSPNQPTSGSFQSAPAIFNLAFRFDEPQGLINLNTQFAFGNWFDENQANALADGHSGTALAELDVAALDDGEAECRWLHAPGRDQARIFASRMNVPEGVHSEAPNFGGLLQPYMLHLPPPSNEEPGFTLTLHGNSATYTQWHTASPNYLVQMGDERNHILLSPLGRSTRRAGVPFDWFEAWADVARRFKFDWRRTAISGYSAGGYSTFYTAASFPDLFGGAFPIVAAARLLDGGVQGDHTNYISHLNGLRWVPTVAWNQLIDELAPYAGIRLTMLEMNNGGLRNELFSFPVGEHFSPGVVDQWRGGAQYLGPSWVTQNPHRVDFTIAPENWSRFAPPLGTGQEYPEAHLVADHAYWVSELRTREEIRDETGTVRGRISATSLAFGLGDPITTPVARVYPGLPLPATVDGTAWDGIAPIEAEDRLIIEANNIASLSIDMQRAQLSCAAEFTVNSDGPIRVRLDGCGRELHLE